MGPEVWCSQPLYLRLLPLHFGPALIDLALAWLLVIARTRSDASGAIAKHRYEMRQSHPRNGTHTRIIYLLRMSQDILGELRYACILSDREQLDRPFVLDSYEQRGLDLVVVTI